MLKRSCLRAATLFLFLQVATPVVSAAELTAIETRWLQAAAPMLAHARSLDLPIDIVVQPAVGPNDVPMAMGFAKGRCKLVLSMRGGADPDAILLGVPEARRALMIEAMAAHEIAHCWRYAQGVWHALPAGFVDREDAAGASQQLAAMAREMREMRREEGYSDLVALAWIASRHPAHYAVVYAWLRDVRARQSVAGGGHDTMAWVALAHDPAVFRRDAVAFEAVDALWTAGLLQSR